MRAVCSSSRRKAFGMFISFALVLMASACTAVDTKAKKNPVVLTGTQPTFSITSALVEGTDIEVVNVPADGRRFNLLKDYLERRMDQFAPLFESADVVVSMTNALPGDPLFRLAREANIHLINVDAAQPWSFTTTGVAIIEQPASNAPWADHDAEEEQPSGDSPYFWLSLTNAVRMSDIVGNDLARIYVEDAEQIIANKNRLKQQFLAMGREFQNRLFSAPDITVFALANEFVYLTNDTGIFVDGYFLKQDIDWSDEDLTSLTDHLISGGIKVVLHKWEPSDTIQAAISAADAQLVVLDTADPGIAVDRVMVQDGYQQILQQNLDRLTAALVSE